MAEKHKAKQVTAETTEKITGAKHPCPKCGAESPVETTRSRRWGGHPEFVQKHMIDRVRYRKCSNAKCGTRFKEESRIEVSEKKPAK